jgi:hypothetical protein
MPTEGKRCFVISPIGAEGSEVRKHADQVLHHLVKPAMEELGIEVIRSDEIAEPGTISRQMFEHLMGDDLCVAVLTGHNANVFYELGVAHATGRPAILLIDKKELLPFDIKDVRAVFYDFDPDALEQGTYVQQIVAYVRALDEAGWKAEGPVDFSTLAQQGRQNRFFDTLAGDEVLILLPPHDVDKVVPGTAIHTFFGVMELSEALTRQGYRVRKERADQVGGDALRMPLISAAGPVSSKVSKFLLEQPEIIYSFGGLDGHTILSNRNPEFTIDAVRAGEVVTRDFGVVTRMRNPYNKDSDAIVVSGCFGWGTQAALRVLTDTESLEFLTTMGRHFQVICTCLVDEDGVGTDAQLVDISRDPSIVKQTFVTLYDPA